MISPAIIRPVSTCFSPTARFISSRASPATDRSGGLSGRWARARAAKSSTVWIISHESHELGIGNEEEDVGSRWIVLLAILLAGCGRSSVPLAVHGKPVAHWLQALHESDTKSRRKAVEALGNVGAADPAVIPALIATLE